jgi:hypothetical protein
VHLIVLIVDPDCENRNQQDHCGYEEHDFHGSSIGWTAAAPIRGSVQSQSARSTA